MEIKLRFVSLFLVTICLLAPCALTTSTTTEASTTKAATTSTQPASSAQPTTTTPSAPPTTTTTPSAPPTTTTPSAPPTTTTPSAPPTTTTTPSAPPTTTTPSAPPTTITPSAPPTTTTTPSAPPTTATSSAPPTTTTTPSAPPTTTTTPSAPPTTTSSEQPSTTTASSSSTAQSGGLKDDTSTTSEATTTTTTAEPTTTTAEPTTTTAEPTTTTTTAEPTTTTTEPTTTTAPKTGCAANPCENGGFCVSLDEINYKCICTDGWMGDNCDTDINECTSSPSLCDSDNQKCNNTAGSYECLCKDGYKPMDDGSCRKIVLWDYYNNENSTKIDQRYTVSPPVSFPYFSSSFDELQVYANGFISFGAYHFKGAAPGEVAWPNSPVLFSVYWADMTFASDGGVWVYQEDRLSDVSAPSAMLDAVEQRVGVAAFKPLWGVVVTWLMGKPTSNAKPEDVASFQVILATDGQLSYAILNYDTIWENTEFAGRPHVTYAYSGLNGKYTAGNVPGDLDETKTPLFSSGTPDNSNYMCMEKLKIVSSLADKVKTLPPCPCFKSQASLDWAFKPDDTGSCFHSRFSYQGFKQTCCYSGYGTLLTNEKDAKFPSENVQLTDANTACCTKGNLCGQFYSMFPSTGCSMYKPPKTVFGFGDPHLSTLDGNKLTVNGLGEYTVLQFESSKTDVNQWPLVLQGRMELTELNSKSTRFTAYALQLRPTYPSYEIYIDSASTLQVAWNGTEPSDFTNVGEIEKNGAAIQVFLINGFGLKISLKQPDATSTMYLMHEIRIPSDYLPSGDNGYSTNGLLGRYNGDKTDDFALGNGTQLQGDVGSLTSADVNAFLESWRVSETSSLFTYTKPDDTKSYSDFNNDSFVPPDIPTTVEKVLEKFESEDLKKQAQELCGDKLFCLQDFLVNKDNSSAEQVLAEVNNIDNVQDTMSAVQLNFTEIASITIKPSQPASVTLTLAGDVQDVTFSVAATDFGNNGPEIKENSLFWNITDHIDALRGLQYPLTLTLRAKSGSSLGETTPEVFLCLCAEESHCDGSLPPYTTEGQSGNVHSQACVCNDDSMKGPYCNQQVAVCTLCFDPSACNNSLTSDYCAPCPSGYEGDGFKCKDINECDVNQGGCQTKCTNTLGSYECSCDDGYVISTADNRTCEDVNECDDETKKCTKPLTYCVNTPGSHQCQCYPGYENFGGNCLEYKTTFVGALALANQAWSDKLLDKESSEFKDLSSKIINAIESKLKTQTWQYIVSVLQFQKGNLVPTTTPTPTSSGARRKKREATPPEEITVTFKIVTDSNTLEVSELSTALAVAPCADKACYYPDQNGIVVSAFPLIKTESLCASVDPCDSLTASCEAENENRGTKCVCKPGFTTNYLDYTRCDDIDECSVSKPNCPRCENILGNYNCHCQDGYVWDYPTEKCILGKCETNPCQHGGECISLKVEPGYACKCTAEWTGPNCADEDSDYRKLEIAVICVSVILGVLCLFLFIILLVVCLRKKKTIENDAYTNSRFNDFGRLPRPKVTDNGQREMSENGRSMYDNPQAEVGSRRYEELPTKGQNAAGSARYVYKNDAFDGERL